MNDGTEPSDNRVLGRGRKWLAYVALICGVGALSTGIWIGTIQAPLFRSHLISVSAVASLLIGVVLTSANLMLRWFRWHFLIRRFTPSLITRDSMAVYLSTLPSIVSPFFIAELVRVPLIRKRFRTPASYLVRIWLLERLLDACVLGSALLFALGTRWAWAALAAFGAFAWLLFRGVLRGKHPMTVHWVTAAAVGSTVLAWTFPVVALSITLRILDNPVGASDAVRVFASGTLLGGLSGVPLGVSVTGSTMIGELLNIGVTKEAGVLAILVYRGATAWFAVGLGIVAMFLFRHRLLRMLRGEAEVHFDEIANEYESEIPEHVRDRLLLKKIRWTDETLAAHGISRASRGLDLGCGQGWYLNEMCALGYTVDGTDFSAGQLGKAEAHLERNGRTALLVQADAQQLPFPDASYDFVYSINAIHHMLSPGAQARTLQEIVRVLRPGGVFILHEINTYNPLFRLYMGYVFPLLKRIDEGNEEWVLPTALPKVRNACWATDEIRYFTFLPDFIPSRILNWLAPIEQALESSGLRRFSAHYQACLVKDSLASSTSVAAAAASSSDLLTASQLS